MKNLKPFNKKFNKRLLLSYVILLTIILLGIAYFAISYVEKMEKKIGNMSKETLQLVSSQNVKTIQKEVFSKQEFLKVIMEDMEREERFDILETKEIKFISVIIMIAGCSFSGLWILYCFLYQKRVNNRIFYDSLTKGKNYEYLKHTFYKEDSKNKSLIALDIDKFKIINMMYGLSVGDQMLLYLYGIFKEVLPKDVLYRNKADEFVGIIYHETKQELINKLEVLNQRIQEDMKNNKIYYMTISIGVCALEEYSSLQRIYGNAIIAKNQIKGNTNIVYNFFDNKLKESFIECGRIESKFETALEKKEFEVWYQPKYNMRSEKIISAEALVRWREENGNLISPGKFIPVFEKNGQILRLDEEIIKIVYKDLREAKEFGVHTVPISINLSRLHLDCPEFIGKIEQLTKEYGIEPCEIVFEITESTLLGDKKSLNCFIEGLHRLGFQVDMDDYGTGVSSLDSLSSFSFDAIKLDKSFIHNIGNKKMDIVIQSTIKMAKDLDMQIIAEGVETKEQVKFLLENNCLIAQGFYYSKPLEREQYFLKLQETKEKK